MRDKRSRAEQLMMHAGILVTVLFCLFPIEKGYSEEGPVAYYDFDDGTGTVLHDRSGNNNNGKIYGPKWVKGIKGHALEFDGLNDIVECGKSESMDIGSTGTVMVWVCAKAYQGGILSRSTGPGWLNGRLVLSLRSANRKLIWTFSEGKKYQFSYFGTPKLNIWQHFAVTFDGKRVRLYENGSKIDDKAQHCKPDVKGIPLKLGFSQGLGKSYYKGLMDEIKIYDRALPDLEIRNAYLEAVKKQKVVEKTKEDRYVFPEESKDVFAIKITCPSYRNNIYATQEIDEIKLKAYFNLSQHDLSKKILPVMLRGNKKTYFSRKYRKLTSGMEIIIPSKKLPVGKYEITVSINNRDGSLYANAKIEEEIRKLPPCEGEVRIDENLIVLVDGEPFLPVGWFWAWPYERFTEERLININTIHTHAWFQSTEAIRDFLDECKKNGLKATIYPYQLDCARFGGKRLRDGTWTKPLSEEEANKIRKVVSSVHNHPALLGWYMADEPEAHATSVERLKQVYEVVRDADPYHPCIMLNTHPHGVKKFIDCGDIMMPDEYPNFQRYELPVTPFTEIADIVEAARGTRPVWIVPQAFDWGEMPTSMGCQPKARGPNYIEFRNNAFLAIAHGAAGIMWCNSTRGFAVPSVRYGYPYLCKELQVLRDAILSQEIEDGTEVIPQDTKISVSLRKVKDKLFLFAVNHTHNRIDVDIEVKGCKNEKILVVSEARFVAVKEGIFREHFEPYETHIYTNDLSEKFASLSTVKEVEAEIEKEKRERIKQGNILLGAVGLSLESSGCLMKNKKRWDYDAYNYKRVILRHLVDGIYDYFLFCECRVKNDEWVQINLETPQTITRIVIYTAQDKNIMKGNVQVESKGKWITVSNINNNNRNRIEMRFEPLKISKIRVCPETSTCEDETQLTEIEAYRN